MDRSILQTITKSQALALATDLVKRFEGCDLAPYHDPVGFPTQGWGRLLSREKWADLAKWPTITQETANAWLLEDLLSKAAAVRRLCPVPLTDGQYAALIDFAFNVGAGNLEVSTLRKCVTRGDHDEVPIQLRKWVFAGGVKLPGLVRRREAEIGCYLS
jgi:lysozyme